MIAHATIPWIAWIALTLGGPAESAPVDGVAGKSVRLATFNIKELNAAKLAQVDAQGRGTNMQLRKAAEIIQRMRPDVLFINEIDFDVERQQNAVLFRDRYLKHGQTGQRPIDYPHIFFAPVNTGVPTGQDLDHDGRADGPADAYGFGHYPGEYGMALFSRVPIEQNSVRRFQQFLWQDMPGNLMPDGRDGKPRWYSEKEAVVLRLSSKSHWDVPLRVGERLVHILASHPTPPIFDGPEDRNGRRNFDENRLWADYVSGSTRGDYIIDDTGRRGGLPAGELFVIAGDLNSDPIKMEPHAAYRRPPIQMLLSNERIQDPKPRSLGSAAEADDYPGDKTTLTNEFGRIDYVLPCRELRISDAGVFWPPPGDMLHPLVSDPDAASDHRLVWVDIEVPH
jgi:endonuclease/exonuclease/phosphatase family metal-dependent hydrolase